MTAIGRDYVPAFLGLNVEYLPFDRSAALSKPLPP